MKLKLKCPLCESDLQMTEKELYPTGSEQWGKEDSFKIWECVKCDYYQDKY